MSTEEDHTTEEEEHEEPASEEPETEEEKPEEVEEDEEPCVKKIGDHFLDKLAKVLSKGRVTINLILYTLMGIIISPFIDSMQTYAVEGIADFDQFFSVIKYVAAPFVMLIATKRIMDDLAEKGESTKKELSSCRKELIDAQKKINDDNQTHKLQLMQQEGNYLLRLEQQKGLYELQLEQRQGIIEIKNHEIEKLNNELKMLKGVK